MSDNASVLLPAPVIIMRPVVIELLLNERTVLIILKMSRDGICCFNKEIPIFLFIRCKAQVDKVCGGVITYRVPVFLTLVSSKTVSQRIKENRIDMRIITASFLIMEVFKEMSL